MTAKTGKKDTETTLPITYAALISQHMLRPVRDAVDYANAAAVLDAMSGMELNSDQADYLEALSMLVEAYEDTQEEMDALHQPRGHALLVYLCEENTISAAALGRLLGVSRAQGSLLLKGKRNLTVAHARVLAERFAVTVETFL